MKQINKLNEALSEVTSQCTDKTEAPIKIESEILPFFLYFILFYLLRKSAVG